MGPGSNGAGPRPDDGDDIECIIWAYVQRYYRWVRVGRPVRSSDGQPYLDGQPLAPSAFLATLHTLPAEQRSRVEKRVRNLWDQSDARGGAAEARRDWLVPLDAFELETDEEGREKQLGTGGMGIVLAARDRVLGRAVAIKFIRAEKHTIEALRRRLLDEARFQSELQHPGLVPVYQYGLDPARGPFIVMEPIPGEELSAVLDRTGAAAWDTQVLLDVFLKVCQAVGYAHRKNLSHRDLKPENVKVGTDESGRADGQVRVLDWGLGREQTCEAEVARGDGTAAPFSTATSTVAGTWAYMSPEQANARRIADPRLTDVFLLGGLLCKILTGHPPYAGENIEQAAKAAALGPAFRRLEERASEYPDLVGLAKRSLEEDETKRPPHADVVAESVVAYQRRVAEAYAAQKAERAVAEVQGVEQAKRRRLLKAGGTAGAIGTVVLLLVGGWIAWNALAHRADNERSATQSLDQCELALRDDDAGRAGEHLGRAEQRRTDGGCESLASRFARCRTDLEALQEFDRVGDARWNEVAAGRLDPDRVFTDLPGIFERYGIVPGERLSADAVERASESLIRVRLLQELDCWLARDSRPDLLPVLRAVDPDPLRDEVRAALVRRAWGDVGVLVERAIASAQPPRFLAALGEVRALAPDLKERALRAAVRGRPRSFSMHMTLGGTYPADTPRAVDARVGCYQAALSGRPGSAVALTYLGVALHDKHDLDGAIRCHEAALGVDPGCVSAHNNLAVVLLTKGNFDGAERAARAAIQLDPESRYSAPRHNLGLALSAKGDKEGALGMIREAIQINGKLASTHFNLGNILNGLGQTEQAINHYRQATTLDPNFTPAYHHWAMTLHDQRKWKEAVAVYEVAIKADPQERFLWNGLGNALTEMGDLKGAIYAYKAAVVLSPDYPTAHANLARVLIKRSEWREAVKHFKELVRLEPNSADYKNGLKMAEFAAGLATEPAP